VDAPGRVVHPLLVVALVVAAVVGYLVGHRHASGSASGEDPPPVTRSLSSSGLLLEYPTDWQRASQSTSIPGLSLTRAVTLHPRAGASAGLLTGQLPSGQPGPLPASFLARLHGLPHVEVVDLVSTQAFRYSQLTVSGYSDALDLYVIPTVAQGGRVMACFASQPLTPASQECEHIVADVALTGPPPAPLTPEATYAQELSAVVTSLAAERARARKEMGSSDSAGRVGSAASTLAAHLSAAAASLAALESPPLVASAATALNGALQRAAAAYSSLSAAAAEESVSAYDSARDDVAAAEAQVNTALANFTLLGYGAA
jgi:hypothetical protein